MAGSGVSDFVTVTSARGTIVLVTLPPLFAVFASATVDEMAVAELLRVPPSPPGRMAICIFGQLLPAVQTGSDGIVHVSVRPLLPLAAFEQVTADA